MSEKHILATLNATFEFYGHFLLDTEYEYALKFGVYLIIMGINKF